MISNSRMEQKPKKFQLKLKSKFSDVLQRCEKKLDNNNFDLSDLKSFLHELINRKLQGRLVFENVSW